METGKEKNRKGMGPEAGISLFETLLVVGLVAVTAVGAINIAKEFQEREEDIAIADELTTVHQAAKVYVRSNFINIWQGTFGENGLDAATATDFNGDATIDALDVCCVGTSVELPIDPDPPNLLSLKDVSGALPLAFPRTNGFGQGMTVFLRDAGYVGDKRTIEVFTMTFIDATTPDGVGIAEGRAMGIARLIGARAGVLPERLDLVGNTEEVSGFYGGWRVGEDEVAALLNANGYASMLSPPSAGGTRSGTHLIIYETVSFQDEIRDGVLYKVSVPGHPEINRMEANLDMENRQMLNVEYLVADNLRVSDAMTFLEGDRQAGGPVAAGSAFVISGGMRVESDSSRINATTRYVNAADAITDPVTGAVVDDRCRLRGGWRDGGVGNDSIDPAAVGPCAVEGGVLTATRTVTVDQFEANGASLSARRIVTPGDINVLQNLTAGSIQAQDFVGNTILAQTYRSLGPNALVFGAAPVSVLANDVATGNLSARTFDVNTTRAGEVNMGGALDASGYPVPGSLTGSLSGQTVIIGDATALSTSAINAVVAGSVGTLTSCLAEAEITNIPPAIIAEFGLDKVNCVPPATLNLIRTVNFP